MEIKLSAGDKINIPENCTATTIAPNKGQKKQEFKDGDILHSKTTDRVIIFKSYVNEFTDESNSHYNNRNEPNSGWGALNFRHATEEEKQKLFDELKAKGLQWNEETKTMQKL